jgi:hypothetical protein
MGPLSVAERLRGTCPTDQPTHKRGVLGRDGAAERAVNYLSSGKADKQKMALAIATADGITSGPICAFTAVELCSSYAIRANRAEQKIQLERSYRKCLFIYQYWMHPLLGFMSARLQTWFPFPVHIYMNGRAWLAQQMDQAKIRYRRHDNCLYPMKYYWSCAESE